MIKTGVSLMSDINREARFPNQKPYTAIFLFGFTQYSNFMFIANDQNTSSFCNFEMARVSKPKLTVCQNISKLIYFGFHDDILK